MTDIDRYITNARVEHACRVQLVEADSLDATYTGMGPALQAILPGILAQHKADVLAEHTPIVAGIVAQAQREARADALREAADVVQHWPGNIRDVREKLYRMAHEAVAE